MSHHVSEYVNQLFWKDTPNIRTSADTWTKRKQPERVLPSPTWPRPYSTPWNKQPSTPHRPLPSVHLDPFRPSLYRSSLRQHAAKKQLNRSKCGCNSSAGARTRVEAEGPSSKRNNPSVHPPETGSLPEWHCPTNKSAHFDWDTTFSIACDENLRAPPRNSAASAIAGRFEQVLRPSSGLSSIRGHKHRSAGPPVRQFRNPSGQNVN